VTGSGIRKQTEGIEVEDWKPDGEGGLTFSTWDFAGQDVYYNTHQFFLSQRSLYMVVFSLCQSLEENNVLTWLNSLQVRAPRVPVLLVGTHADHKVKGVGLFASSALRSQQSHR
jgi:GTPase SAR1 family protein